MMKLTEPQINFFETFGYLAFPGLLADSIDWITEEFEAVFTDRGIVHDGTKRSCIVPFVDQRERLCTLLDDPRIEGIATSLIGEGFNYVAGDGNYYTGDTPWHSDGYHTIGKFIKIAFYLDRVTKDTGALRVIPGSHRLEHQQWAARQAARATELWGVEQKDVPSVALETSPGDVVVFNHNLMHASFGGSTTRRMFTLNLCRRAQTEEEFEELKSYIGAHGRFWIDHMHSDAMKQTASPQRMTHLQQVIENESHLAALADQSRLEMPEASRG